MKVYLFSFLVANLFQFESYAQSSPKSFKECVAQIVNPWLNSSDCDFQKLESARAMLQCVVVGSTELVQAGVPIKDIAVRLNALKSETRVELNALAQNKAERCNVELQINDAGMITGQKSR